MTTEQIDAVYGRERDRQYEAVAADPTELIYRDPEGGFARTPPAGKLDGWEARRLRTDLWGEYETACAEAESAVREANKASTRRDALRERLVNEWDRA